MSSNIREGSGSSCILSYIISIPLSFQFMKDDYMNNFFDILKSIYTKTSIEPSQDNTTNILVTKWLSYDITNLSILNSLVKYLFYIEPQHYFYLLFFNIRYSEKPPFLKKVEKIKEKENELFDKIRYVMDWSSRELRLNSSILDKLITPQKKYWKEQLGLK